MVNLSWYLTDVAIGSIANEVATFLTVVLMLPKTQKVISNHLTDEVMGRRPIWQITT